ncbi:MAG: tetratricopeptide repeat protein [Rickettsiales bacterium]
MSVRTRLRIRRVTLLSAGLSALICGGYATPPAFGRNASKSDLEAFAALTQGREAPASESVLYAAADVTAVTTDAAPVKPAEATAPEGDPFAALAAENAKGDAPKDAPAGDADAASPAATDADLADALGEGDADATKPTEEQIFADVKDNALFREIATKYPSFTDKQLFKIVGTCVMLPQHLEHCVPFACEQLETPNLSASRKREVIGSYDGKCYYRETSNKGDVKHVECELTKEEQKILADQIALDVSRLSKTDILVEDAAREAAKKIYDACLERTENKDSGTLLAALKQPQDDMQRIRQLYVDRAEQKGAISDAVAEYQISKEKRDRLQQELVGSLREKRELPTPESFHRNLWDAFPEKPQQKDPAYAEAEANRRKSLAEYLKKLEDSESDLPASLRMPKELKAAMADINDYRREKREREGDVVPVTLQYSDFLDTGAIALGDKSDKKPEGEKPAPSFVIKVSKIGSGPASESAQEKLYEAFDALVEGQYAAAVAMYKEVLAEKPDNADALFGIAGAYHKLGQVAQARPYYEKGVALAPERDDMLNNFLALLGEESPENSLIELKKLEAVSPDLAAVPAQIGIIYYNLKDYSSAVAALKRAVAIDDDNGYYLYNLAVALDKGGKASEASYYYNKYLRVPEKGRAVASRDVVEARIASLELSR